MHGTRALLCGLLAVSLLATAGCNRSGKARKNARPSPADVALPAVAAASAPLPVSWDVKGWGRNQQEAVEDAVRRQARERLSAHLASLNPPVLWVPPAPQVGKYLTPAKERRVPAEDSTAAGEPVECWAVTVTLTPEKQRALAEDGQAEVKRQQRLEREARSAERLGLATRGLGALVLLLFGVYAYVRLDGWAGRRGTGWLRAGVVVAVAAGGAGLWLLA